MLATNGRRGPAAARNVGWRASHADWIAFLDDDVVPMASWFERLGHDLDTADRDPAIGGVQGRIVVPLPADRRPTNWERDVAGLEAAAFVTADLAYRRTVLERVGGFDEHFTGAYREDADLALRCPLGRLRDRARHSCRTSPGRSGEPVDHDHSPARQRGRRTDARQARAAMAGTGAGAAGSAAGACGDARVRCCRTDRCSAAGVRAPVVWRHSSGPR